MAVVMIMIAGAHRGGPRRRPAVAAGGRAAYSAGGWLGVGCRAPRGRRGGSPVWRPGGQEGACQDPAEGSRRRVGTSEWTLYDKIFEKRPFGALKNPNELPGPGRPEGGAPSQKAPGRPAGGCPST